MGKDSKLMPETLHKVFMISNTLIYMLCKPLLRVLAGAYTTFPWTHLARMNQWLLFGCCSGFVAAE